MKDTIKIDVPFKGMVAHRGAAFINTENTMRAFTFASTRSYHGMECDIHPTKDGHIVICHDSNINRVSGIDAYIPNHTLKELYEMPFIDINTNKPDKDLHVFLLSDYLELCKKTNKVPVIELKETLKEEDVVKTVEIVKSFNLEDKAVFISFFPGYLTKIRQMLPNAEIEFLTQMYTDSILDLCIQFNFGIDADYHCMREDIIKKYHEHNLKVNVYTCNDPDIAKKLISWGIDYITTNILE